MNPSTRLQVVERRRRAELVRLGEQTAKNGIVQGEALIHSEFGSGHAIVDLPFPVTFVQRPIFTYGFVLDESDRVGGNIPLLSAMLVTWDRRFDTDDRVWWGGGHVGVRVSGGWKGIRFWLHYEFSGVALQNPTMGRGGVGEVL